MPHYLPGENPFLKTSARSLRLSPTAPTGGVPQTIYPEYQKTLQPSEWTAGDRRGSTAPGRGHR